ncbi:MAG: UbiD family decarboxylase, partial [Candidatus Caldarchaeum sp.]
MYADFQAFLGVLEKEGELRRIRHPLSPKLEITEVADRCMKRPGGGPALLIENPVGFDIPVAINALGSRRRVSLALGVGDVEDISRELEEILAIQPPGSLLEKLRALKKIGRFAQAIPKVVSSGICQQIVLQGK